MNPPRLLLHRCYLLALTVVYWAAVHGVAWAQETAEKSSSSESGAGPWVLPYAIVILCIGLGMMTIIRSARRQDRAKQEYEATVLAKQEEQKAAAEPKKRLAGKRPKEECKEAKNALILAIVGFLCCGLIVSPIALFQGLKAKKMIAENPRLIGEGKALAAIIISAVAIVCWLLPIVIWMLMLVGAVVSSS